MRAEWYRDQHHFHMNHSLCGAHCARTATVDQIRSVDLIKYKNRVSIILFSVLGVLPRNYTTTIYT